MADDAIERLSGTTLDGRFTLDAFVARGGYGAVYRGTHLALRRTVAVKVLAVPEVYEGAARARFVEAFEAEALTVAGLHHPAIVRVHDVGVTTVEGRAYPYTVLEWIEGATLDATLRSPEAGPRSPREVLALLRPVFEAIASAHEAGVVHRDLKPANVMVAPTLHGEVSTRVLDFGLAKAFAPEERGTNGNSFTGDEGASFSLSHAAPEQVGRLRTGPWTDVHALALLLVEVLVGQRAYRGETSIDLYARITARERPTPRTFDVEVGPWEAVLDRALALMAKERHRDAAALLADLEANLDGAQRAWHASRAPTPPSHATARSTSRRWALGTLGLACVALASAAALRVRVARPRTSDHRSPPAVPATAPLQPSATPDAGVERALGPLTASAQAPSAERVERAPVVRRSAARPRVLRPADARLGVTADGEIEIE